MAELFDQDAIEPEPVEPIVLMEYHQDGCLIAFAKLVGALMVLIIVMATFMALFLALIVTAMKGP